MLMADWCLIPICFPWRFVVGFSICIFYADIGCAPPSVNSLQLHKQLQCSLTLQIRLMGSACQVGMDGPSRKDVSGIGNVALENGHHEARADADEWREKEEDLANGHSAPPGMQQVDEQEQQGQSILWERFLPVKTLRVLLVENDNSTRQVVSALLRKCCYEVIPAENGLHAWRYLEDMQNNIDLVLTEVFMPCLSGIGLLSKITSHKICKDIPVIMMSSNDSMSMVFKCLSKGAVDFLVKPLRKNELKNLWQHVWRRCHSSSGSGSESGIQTQKCAKPNTGDEYENDSDSNHDDEENDDDDDDDDFSVGLNARDGSDNGSGTQSSWTKRAVEIDSPQPMSPDQLAGPPDSTCAQVIHPKSEICSNKWLPTANKRNGKKQKEIKDESMGRYLEIGAPRNSSAEYQSSLNDVSVNPTEKRHETHIPQCKSKKNMMTEDDCANIPNEANTETADLISSIARNTEDQQAVRAVDAPDDPSKMPDGNDKNHDSHIEVTPHELGLKRLRTNGATAEIHDERNILKRSDQSAFTRYHTSVASNQGGARYGESSSPQDNSCEAVKTDSTCKMKSNSDASPIKQGSNGSSNNDVGSSTKNVVAKSSGNRERVTSPSAIKSTQHASAFHTIQNQTSPANLVGKDKADEGVSNAVKLSHPTEVPQSCVQHHHHVHYYLHVMTRKQPSIDRGSSDVQCGSSNVFDPPVEGHAANYSMNGGVSVGHNGCNGQNGNSAVPNIARPNIESVNGTMSQNIAGGGIVSGSGSGNDVYQNRFPQREAALNKFRLKRKDRNFGKKVRYQNRKRLAEQRPRVRGQFVRRSGQEDQAAQGSER